MSTVFLEEILFAGVAATVGVVGHCEGRGGEVRLFGEVVSEGGVELYAEMVVGI